MKKIWLQRTMKESQEEQKEEKNEILKQTNHKNPSTFIFRVLLSTIFCLLILIALKGAFGSQVYEWTKKGLNKVYDEQINFVKAQSFIEKYFGSADLAILPFTKGQESEKIIEEEVSARVITSFNEMKTGVMIEMEPHASVSSGVDGVVIFAGKKEESGQTIIIQVEDGTEYWYGELEELKCKVYDLVTKNQVIGIAGAKNNGESSQYYFALKKKGTFVDPRQVLPFES